MTGLAYPVPTRQCTSNSLMAHSGDSPSSSPRRGAMTADLGRTSLMTGADISRALSQVADQLVARYAGGPAPLLVGVHTRGVDVAKRLLALLQERGCDAGFGTLDISLYRDDLDNLGTMPSLRGSDLPQQVEGVDVVLVDDVLFTGRTVRAAIDGVTDFGRPRRIELAVLVDRGNRELPIQADYVGESITTERSDYVAVHLEESDGEEGVFLLKRS